jgi:seryl-tRNA synthetase
MLQTNYIIDNQQEIIERLQIKNFDASQIIPQIEAKNNQRKSLQKDLDNSLAEANQLAKSIGQLFKHGKREEAEQMKARSAELKSLSKDLSDQKTQVETELQELIVSLPNIPHESVKPGKGEEDNEIVAEFGNIPSIEGEALPHWELTKKYDIIDFELGVKLTGAGFPVYKGKGAKLQRALISFFLDEATDAGYNEVLPPLMVNEDSAYGTGQVPDKEGQMYHMQTDNLYMIPTAEVPVTNIYRNIILKESDFPKKNVAYSACFRREAGSYGKDVRGLNRLHQFDKVEIVQIQHPEKSYDTLEEMKSHVAGLLEKLELPYRVLRLCGGDLSFTSALTFDYEVFSAAQERWLEVSSVSNFENFQSNRLKLRYKDENGKTQLAHTLNGSALALPRIMAALLENNQSSEGIKIPETLQKYTGFDIIN